jgi:single-strand selective monofunctional uracil DNA glycosylase
MKPIKELIASTRRLVDELRPIGFGPPVACVYQPLEYAWEPHREYLERFANGKKRVVFLGMNPGPFGMVQTGVPFGEVAAVRDWLGITEPVGKPAEEHPKRPVEGFACQRSEVSGRRLWGLFAERFGTPEAFFKDHFVLNYCPLVWMSGTGANLTPDKLPATEMAPVEQACLKHLSEVISLLRPQFLIGIGAFAEERLRRAAEQCGSDAQIGRILHPSPASPAANRGWAEAASRQLADLGVWQ